MKELVTTNGHAQAQTNGHAPKPSGRPRPKKTNPQDMTALIEHAVKIRNDVSELINALKQQRRQNRAMQQTLATIRQLKTLV